MFSFDQSALNADASAMWTYLVESFTPTLSETDFLPSPPPHEASRRTPAGTHKDFNKFEERDIISRKGLGGKTYN